MKIFVLTAQDCSDGTTTVESCFSTRIALADYITQEYSKSEYKGLDCWHVVTQHGEVMAKLRLEERELKYPTLSKEERDKQIEEFINEVAIAYQVPVDMIRTMKEIKTVVILENEIAPNLTGLVLKVTGERDDTVTVEYAEESYTFNKNQVKLYKGNK